MDLDIFMDADISWARTFHGREYFMDANISWAPTFHGREYFMGANISWARIFHGREYFMGANILCVNYYCRRAPIFNDFCSQFCQFYFCNKFCLISAANICVCFQYLFLHVLCANIFGANVLESRFKIDVVIMII